MQRRPQDESLRERQTMLVRVPSVEKYRRMTCLTHIHSGICPYGRRCVFLHDPRVSSTRPGLRAFPASKGTPKSANVKDTFYWPDQRKEDISANLEPGTNLPACNQEYNIPEAFQMSSCSLHDRGLYSMWNFFIDFMLDINDNDSSFYSTSKHVDCETNAHVSSMRRLPVFLSLGRGLAPTSRELIDSVTGSARYEVKDNNDVAVNMNPSISIQPHLYEGSLLCQERHAGAGRGRGQVYRGLRAFLHSSLVTFKHARC